MKFPLQITFRHMSPSPALETRIRELASRLDTFSDHIMRCHVIVEPPPHHHGALHDFRIDITLPDEEIAIRMLVRPTMLTRIPMSPCAMAAARPGASSRITSPSGVAI